MEQYQEELKTTVIKLGADIVAAASHSIKAVLGVFNIIYQVVAMPFKLAYDKLNNG